MIVQINPMIGRKNAASPTPSGSGSAPSAASPPSANPGG